MCGHIIIHSLFPAAAVRSVSLDLLVPLLSSLSSASAPHGRLGHDSCHTRPVSEHDMSTCRLPRHVKGPTVHGYIRMSGQGICQKTWKTICRPSYQTYMSNDITVGVRMYVSPDVKTDVRSCQIMSDHVGEDRSVRLEHD